MGSRQTTNAFPEQSSSHESDNLSRVTETATSRRVMVTTRAQKKRQEPIESRQDVYGLSLSSQSQNLIELDSELQRRLRRTANRTVTYKLSSSSEEDTDIDSTSTRIRSSRHNKRTQERAELDEPESSTSHNNSSRPNKRRAIRAEGGVSRSEQEAYPIIILPPPYRSDSPLPTIRQTTELETTQESSSYLQPFNLPTTGNNTGGVITLPPISLPQENSAHGGITLPPIRSVFSLGERSRTPEINNEIEVVDLSSPPSYSINSAADPYPNNVVDLTSSPNIHSPAVNSSYKNSNNNHSTPEIIIIDDDSSAEDLSSADPPLPSKGLQLKCAICLDYPKDVSFTPCGHIFCLECISTALKSQKVCSLCRREMKKREIKRLEFKILLK